MKLDTASFVYVPGMDSDFRDIWILSSATVD